MSPYKKIALVTFGCWITASSWSFSINYNMLGEAVSKSVRAAGKAVTSGISAITSDPTLILGAASAAYLTASATPTLTGGPNAIAAQLQNAVSDGTKAAQSNAYAQANVNAMSKTGQGISKSLMDQSVANASISATNVFGNMAAFACNPAVTPGQTHQSQIAMSNSMKMKPLVVKAMTTGTFAPVYNGNGDVDHKVAYGAQTQTGDPNYLQGRSFVSQQSAEAYWNNDAVKHSETLLPDTLVTNDPHIPSCDINTTAASAGNCQGNYMNRYVTRLTMPTPSPELADNYKNAPAGIHYTALVNERTARIGLASYTMKDIGQDNDPNILIKNLGAAGDGCTGSCQAWQEDLSTDLASVATKDANPAVSLNQELSAYARYVSSNPIFFNRLATEQPADLQREQIGIQGMQTLMLYKIMHAMELNAMVESANYAQLVESVMTPQINQAYSQVQ